MDKWERIQAALHGAPMDRVPLALWRHFHGQDRNPATLAQLTADLARRYDLDLVKLTPSGLYAVEDWGAEIVFPALREVNSPAGRDASSPAERESGSPALRDVNSPGTEIEPPYLARPAVAEPESWRTLRQRGTRALDRELEAIRLTRHELGRDWPMVMTIFSPLTLAYKLAGDGLTDHLRVDPDAVHIGLRALTHVTTAFANAALDVGADGLFFASQWICGGFCTREQYEEFGLAYDLEVLEAVSHRSRITVLHLHGLDVFFDLVDDYPVDALSWHDRETPPSLAEARQQISLTFITGLDRDLLRTGPPEAIAAQAGDAIAQTGGRGLILAPACVMAPDTPEVHLRAVVDALTG